MSVNVSLLLSLTCLVNLTLIAAQSFSDLENIQINIVKRRGPAKEMVTDNFIVPSSKHVQFTCSTSVNLDPDRYKLIWKRDTHGEYNGGYHKYESEKYSKIIFHNLKTYHTGTYICAIIDLQSMHRVSKNKSTITTLSDQNILSDFEIFSKAINIKVVNMKEYLDISRVSEKQTIYPRFKLCTSEEQLTTDCVHGTCGKLDIANYSRSFCICEPGFMGPNCQFEDVKSVQLLMSSVSLQQNQETALNGNFRQMNTNVLVSLGIIVLSVMATLVTTILSFVNLKNQLKTQQQNQKETHHSKAGNPIIGINQQIIPVRTSSSGKTARMSLTRVNSPPLLLSPASSRKVSLISDNSPDSRRESVTIYKPRLVKARERQYSHSTQALFDEEDEKVFLKNETKIASSLKPPGWKSSPPSLKKKENQM